jgi:hypothetical protein
MSRVICSCKVVLIQADFYPFFIDFELGGHVECVLTHSEKADRFMRSFYS